MLRRAALRALRLPALPQESLNIMLQHLVTESLPSLGLAGKSSQELSATLADLQVRAGGVRAGGGWVGGVLGGVSCGRRSNQSMVLPRVSLAWGRGRVSQGAVGLLRLWDSHAGLAAWRSPCTAPLRIVQTNNTPGQPLGAALGHTYLLKREQLQLARRC